MNSHFTFSVINPFQDPCWKKYSMSNFYSRFSDLNFQLWIFVSDFVLWIMNVDFEIWILILAFDLRFCIFYFAFGKRNRICARSISDDASMVWRLHRQKYSAPGVRSDSRLCCRCFAFTLSKVRCVPCSWFNFHPHNCAPVIFAKFLLLWLHFDFTSEDFPTVLIPDTKNYCH